MMLPLVQVLSFPHSSHYHSSQSSLQQSAYSLILAIQDNNYWSWDSEEVCYYVLYLKYYCCLCFQNSRDLLGFQPHPLVRAFYYALPAISSTPVSTEMWLKHISIESQLSDMSCSSLQLLALTLSALLTRNVFSTAMSSSPAEFSLILKAFSALQRSQPNIASFITLITCSDDSCVFFLYSHLHSCLWFSISFQLYHLPLSSSHCSTPSPHLPATNSLLDPQSMCSLHWLEMPLSFHYRFVFWGSCGFSMILSFLTLCLY